MGSMDPCVLVRSQSIYAGLTSSTPTSCTAGSSGAKKATWIRWPDPARPRRAARPELGRGGRDGPAVYSRLPKVHQDESRTQGLDRLELIRFLQVAQTLTIHHGALAYLLGINALGASEAAAVRIEDYNAPPVH